MHPSVSLPFGFAPSAMHCLAHPDGEKATSRAAARKNVPMALSTYSTVSIEDVRAEGGDNPYAFQLSIVKDRNTTLSWIIRAEGESSLVAGHFHLALCDTLADTILAQPPATRHCSSPWTHLSSAAV